MPECRRDILDDRCFPAALDRTLGDEPERDEAVA
jgi:hypothetical protein